MKVMSNIKKYFNLDIGLHGGGSIEEELRPMSKPTIKFVLHECKRLENDLWEVWIDYHYDNSTHVTKDVSHHASKREAEEQRTINKFKTFGR